MPEVTVVQGQAGDRGPMGPVDADGNAVSIDTAGKGRRQRGILITEAPMIQGQRGIADTRQVHVQDRFVAEPSKESSMRNRPPTI